MTKNTNGHDPIRVFVGTSPGGQDAEACLVLEHTLRRRASQPVEITWLHQSNEEGHPGCGWNTERWATPWTGLRWIVPAICGWQGRAVYFDCPQVAVGDVATLADAPMPRGAMILLRRVGAGVHTGCMVWDCAAAQRGAIPELTALRSDVGVHQAVGSLLTDRPRLAGPLPSGWGVLDSAYAQAPGKATGSIHFVSPYTQPHLRLAVPRLRRARREHWFKGLHMRHFCPELESMFDREYASALGSGYSIEGYAPGPAPAALEGAGGASSRGGRGA